MYQPMNVELASRLGMSCAICAQCLWDGIHGALGAEIEKSKGNHWIRMGHRQLSVLIPYLTPHMTKSALSRLVKAGVVRTFNFNDSPFDHTYWYAFTDFGAQLMLASADEED
jgi:hypothetical protein